MTVSLIKNIKIDKITIFKDTKGYVKGVTNSPHIKSEYLGDVEGDGFFYLVKFPDYKEEVCVDRNKLNFH